MAYRLQRGKSVQKSVRRISQKALEKSLKLLKRPAEEEAIHQARKEIKKVRAVLRLVRGGVRKKEYRQAMDRLRKAARCMAPVRDIQVKLATVGKIKAGLEQRFSAETLNDLSKRFRLDLQRRTVSFAEKRRRPTERLIDQAAGNLKKINVKDGSAVVWKGLADTYALGRKKHRMAQRKPTAENLHSWRKRVKDLTYHFELLFAVEPRVKKQASTFDELGEMLGDHHDLQLLLEFLKQSNSRTSGLKTARGRDALIKTIEGRQLELQKRALKSGRELFSKRHLIP